VPSPQPREILELACIQQLVTNGVLVICAGGGGIPVVRDPQGLWVGVEAVIDKDLAAAQLAIALQADRLLLLTDVDAVYTNWGTAAAQPLRRTTPEQLRQYPFAPGSMGPKVNAACRFVEATGGPAAIGNLDQATALYSRQAGTQIHPAIDH
jgi:carbamate kinase